MRSAIGVQVVLDFGLEVLLWVVALISFGLRHAAKRFGNFGIRGFIEAASIGRTLPWLQTHLRLQQQEASNLLAAMHPWTASLTAWMSWS